MSKCNIPPITSRIFKKYLLRNQNATYQIDNMKVIKSSLKISGHNAQATVRSYMQQTKKVVLVFNKYDNINGSCECKNPVPCAHIMAVLLEIQKDQKEHPSKYPAPTQEDLLKDWAGKFSLQNLGKIVNLPVAFNHLKSDRIKALVVSKENIRAEIDDEKVQISESEEQTYWQNPPNQEDCTCKTSDCQHIMTLKLWLIWNGVDENKKPELERRLIEVIDEINQAKLNSFKNTFDQTIESETVDATNSNLSEYKICFAIELSSRNGIGVKPAKLKKLRSGGYGAPFGTNESWIKRFCSANPVSPVMTRALELTFMLDRLDHTGNLETMLAEPLSNSINNTEDEEEVQCFLKDELRKTLRQLSLEEPESLNEIYFPNGKGRAIFRFSQTPQVNETDGSYLFSVLFCIDEREFQIIPTKMGIANGRDSCWVHAFIDKRWWLFEIHGNPKKIMKLIPYSGMNISKKLFPAFMEQYYLPLSNFGTVFPPEGFEIADIQGFPIPRLYLKDYSDTLAIEPRFFYDGNEVPVDDSEFIVSRKDGKFLRIKRDKTKENEHLEQLKTTARVEGEIFVPHTDPITWLADSNKKLIELGFEIYGSQKLLKSRISAHEPKLSINISSGIDWFDLKGSVSFGDESIGIDQLIGTLGKQERFIKLSDGSIGVIPKKWMNKLSGVMGLLHYDSKEENARASKAHIALVDTLYQLAETKSTDDAFDEVRKKFQSFNGISEMPLPKGLQGTLRNYQKAGYDWLHFLREFSFGGCLADEMGLGKTVQVLALLLHEKEGGAKKPSLIIVPTSLIFNWVNEIKKFTPDLRTSVHHGTERPEELKKTLSKTDIIITTYATLRNDIELFSSHKFNYVVLDESQNIKNPAAKTTQSIHKLRANHRLALTGTPIENSALDLWSQFAFLNPNMLGDMEYFRNTFAKKIENEKDEQKTGALRGIVNPFILMRKKENVAQDLPDKQVSVIYCDMDEEQRQVYEQWKNHFRKEIGELIETKGIHNARFKMLEGITRLRQICDQPVLVDESYKGVSGKLELFIEQLEEVISEGHKVLVFSTFVTMLHQIRQKLGAKGIKFSYLDGQTRKRQEVVDEFQSDPERKVFLLSLKAGGLGLNLTAADYVFIIDPWWNPASEMQAIDRAHRIGQMNKVFVYKLITRNSIEEKVLELQESKLLLVKNVITVDESIFKMLDKAAIMNLFS